MDRRKRKTRTAIQKACIELIREKGFDEMSILDIAERADINRGTFYLHFVDKYDMIDQFEQELIDDIESKFPDKFPNSTLIEELIQSRYQPLVQIFTTFQDKRDILEILFQTKGVMTIQDRFHDIVLKMFDANVKRVHAMPSIQTPQLFITVMVSAMIGIAHYWIQGDHTKTPESLALDLINIIINGPAKAAGLIPGEIIDVNSIIYPNK